MEIYIPAVKNGTVYIYKFLSLDLHCKGEKAPDM